MADLTMAPVDELVSALEAAGVQASMDPADLNLPAVWIALEEVRPVNVARSLELRCRLYLVVPDQDPRRAFASLGALYGDVTTVVTPDGPTTTQGVVMPGDPTPLPALTVPVYLYT